MPSSNYHVGDIQTDINKVKQDQTYLFVDRNFQDSIIEYFQFLRREGILCDVTLRVGSHKFSCHRNILGVASPYFRSLFIDSESGRFIKHVDLPQKIVFCLYLKSKKAFILILLAKYLAKSSQSEKQRKYFSHFSAKSTYHDTLRSRELTPTKVNAT